MVDVQKLVMGVVLIVVGFVAVFYTVANLAPTMIASANNMTASGLPLATLFASSGVLLVIFMIALFVGMIGLAFKMFKGK